MQLLIASCNKQVCLTLISSFTQVYFFLKQLLESIELGRLPILPPITFISENIYTSKLTSFSHNGVSYAKNVILYRVLELRIFPIMFY